MANRTIQLGGDSTLLLQLVDNGNGTFALSGSSTVQDGLGTILGTTSNPLNVNQGNLTAALDTVTTVQGFNMSTCAAAGTTTVKTGAGFLQRLVIPTPVASGTLKAYQNTAGSGTVALDTVTLPATLVSDGPLVIEMGLAFTTGLTVVLTGTGMVCDAFWL